jgi:hypothetical protein
MRLLPCRHSELLRKRLALSPAFLSNATSLQPTKRLILRSRYFRKWLMKNPLGIISNLVLLLKKKNRKLWYDVFLGFSQSKKQASAPRWPSKDRRTSKVRYTGKLSEFLWRHRNCSSPWTNCMLSVIYYHMTIRMALEDAKQERHNE